MISIFEKVIPEFWYCLGSTVDQLHRITNIISCALEERPTRSIGSGFLVLGLLAKLRPLLPDIYLDMTCSYLNNRQFGVKQGGAAYECVGVPQGGMLASYFHLVYTTNMPAKCGVILAQYADESGFGSWRRIWRHHRLDGTVGNWGQRRHIGVCGFRTTHPYLSSYIYVSNFINFWFDRSRNRPIKGFISISWKLSTWAGSTNIRTKKTQIKGKHGSYTS